MCRAIWITKATATHSEYVILIAFFLQYRLRERASMSHLYVHFLFCCNWDRVVCEVRNVPKHFADIWIAVFDLVFFLSNASGFKDASYWRNLAVFHNCIHCCWWWNCLRWNVIGVVVYPVGKIWECPIDLIFMDPCIVVWFSRNNQQDATL
jgi:hypothetical protein